MSKRWIRGLACLLGLSLLSGCGNQRTADIRAAATLPPAVSLYAAPDGDEIRTEAREYTLYLPVSGELHLTTRPIWVEAGSMTETAEALIQGQLEAQNEILGLTSGGGRPLTLYDDRPAEISGGICTVNLGASALQLSTAELYRTCVGLATTLCSLDEINFVNVLVADQSVGMDITGNLAMGSLTGHPDENLPVLWEQMEAKRTPLGEDLSRTPLNALATLYYPLEENRGIGCETRVLNFEGQTPQQLASGLMNEMERMLRENRTGGDALSLNSLLIHDPLTSELEDGGRLITLSLAGNAEELLAEQNLDLSCLLAAVTCTLTTFIPGIAAVCVRMGDKLLTELNSRRFGRLPVLGGLLRREAFSSFLRGSAAVCLVRNGRLVLRNHPVDMGEADSARAMLTALMEGPTKQEEAEGLEAPLPTGIQEDDILGIAPRGDTLLVNLSESFRAEIQAAGPEREMLLCYSMVNTLCLDSDYRKVCFYFEGEQVERIAGELYWAGDFIVNPGLLDSGSGLFIFRSYFCKKAGI